MMWLRWLWVAAGPLAAGLVAWHLGRPPFPALREAPGNLSTAVCLREPTECAKLFVQTNRADALARMPLSLEQLARVCRFIVEEKSEEEDAVRLLQPLVSRFPTRSGSQFELDNLLIHAVEQDWNELARAMLEAGANPNAMPASDSMNSASPLRAAVVHKNVVLVELLLNHGARANVDIFEEASGLPVYSDLLFDLLASYHPVSLWRDLFEQPEEADFAVDTGMLAVERALVAAIRRFDMVEFNRLLAVERLNVSFVPAKKMRGFYSPLMTCALLNPIVAKRHLVAHMMRELLVRGAQLDQEEPDIRGNPVCAREASNQHILCLIAPCIERLGGHQRDDDAQLLLVERVALKSQHLNWTDVFSSRLEQEMLVDPSKSRGIQHVFMTPLMAAASLHPLVPDLDLLRREDVEFCGANNVTALFWALVYENHAWADALSLISELCHCHARATRADLLRSRNTIDVLRRGWRRGADMAVQASAKAWVLAARNFKLSIAILAAICAILLYKAALFFKPRLVDCPICLREEADHGFFHTESKMVHRIACAECISQLTSCPLCRRAGILVQIAGY